MLTDELLTYIFDGKPHPLTVPMSTWLGSSRRFTAFVGSFREKIRKKLRVTQDQETLNDLRLELETAYLLLQERALSVIYEPSPSRQIRSPDFAVSFTTSFTFMVEVTRLRVLQRKSSDDPQPMQDAENPRTMPPELERLADVICSKLGQFLPQRGNVLIVGADTLRLTQSDLQTIMLRVQQRAERGDSSFWARYGFRDRASFFQHYERLSEVLVRGSQPGTNQAAVAWVNPRAKHPLPGKVRTALHRSHGVP